VLVGFACRNFVCNERCVIQLVCGLFFLVSPTFRLIFAFEHDAVLFFQLKRLFQLVGLSGAWVCPIYLFLKGSFGRAIPRRVHFVCLGPKHASKLLDAQFAFAHLFVKDFLLL
jgi:hypothetical protein